MGDVRTERGDLVPEGWAEIYRRARTDNYDGLSNAFTVLVITELASWQARAEQAEAALELACQDAWPGEKQWPGLYLQQGQQVVALRALAGKESGSRSTDLEREDGKNG